MEEKKNKKSRIIKGVALLGLFLLVFGVSYALFSITLNGTKKNKIKTGNLSLELLNESGNTLTDNTIGLENAVPMTDEEGKALTPYTFVLKNNGTIDAEYSLSLKDLDLEVGEERLDDQYVALYIEKGTNVKDTEGPYLLSDVKNRILDAGVLKKGMSATYTVYLWLDEDADENAMNKTFLTSLEVNGYQVTENTLSKSIVYRTSTSKKGVTTTYADGTIDVVGSGEVIVNQSYNNADTKNHRIYYDYYTDLLERAGYNLSEIDVSDYSKLRSFLRNTAYKDDNFNNLELEDHAAIFKKYGIKQSIIDQYEYIEDYVDVIREENPELAVKLSYEAYLLGADYKRVSYNNILKLDDRIEDLSLRFTNVGSFSEIHFPTSLKKIKYLQGFGVSSLVIPDTVESLGIEGYSNIFAALVVDEFTIPSSVKYVAKSAFDMAYVKKINILGSTDGWEATWNEGFTGTVNSVQ